MTATQGDQSPPWCVLWHRPGTPPPETLCNALARRGIHLTLVDSPSIALARVMLAAREVAEDGILILLLVEPEGLAKAADTVLVATEYVAPLRAWVYSDISATPLREVTPDDLALWRSLESPPDQEVPPTLKLVSGDSDDDESEEPDVPPSTGPDAGPDAGPNAGPSAGPNAGPAAGSPGVRSPRTADSGSTPLPEPKPGVPNPAAPQGPSEPASDRPEPRGAAPGMEPGEQTPKPPVSGTGNGVLSEDELTTLTAEEPAAPSAAEPTEQGTRSP